MIKVAIIHRRLAHYRLPLYNGISRTHPDFQLAVYCGYPEKGTGGSGITLEKDPSYVRRVKNRTLTIGGKKVLFQAETIRDVLREDYDVAVFEGSLFLLSSIPLMAIRRIKGRTNIIWLKGWPNADTESNWANAMKRRFLRLADAYIVYGEQSKESLRRYGIPPEKISVTQNTVDVHALLHNEERPQPADDPGVANLLERGVPYVYNIGRHIAKKAISDLLKAFSQLQNDARFSNLHLVIGGKGPETPALKNFVRGSHLENVHFVGAISDHDANLLFCGAACCVFPGAVGLALNQAMAAGCAVICADEPGPDSELLIHQKNGLRYEKGNVSALTESIQRLLEQETLQQTLGISARQTIMERATMDNMINRYASALYAASKTTSAETVQIG